jgi:hypothetical protein
VKSNHLSAEKVLAIGNTLGNGDAMQSTVVDNLGSTPGAGGIAILLNLEPDDKVSRQSCRSETLPLDDYLPAISDTSVGRSIVYFLQIRQSRA